MVQESTDVLPPSTFPCICECKSTLSEEGNTMMQSQVSPETPVWLHCPSCYSVQFNSSGWMMFQLGVKHFSRLMVPFGVDLLTLCI